jgi:hypothetical protein
MSARLRSAGQAGTHWRHWVHAVRKLTTLGALMVGRCTAALSSAMVTILDYGRGQESMQSLHPMHAITSLST